MRVRVFTIVAVLIASLALAQAPASASIVVTVSGTTVSVTATGDDTIRMSCGSSLVRINGNTTSPTLACSALTKVTVIGNNNEQTVDGRDLNIAAFTAGPSLTATLGNGADKVTESDRGDTIDLGGGDDELVLRLPTVANPTLDLGADADKVTISATTVDETTTATSTGTSVTVGISNTSGATSYTVLGAENLSLNGLTGNDTLSTTGITAASAIDFVYLHGDDGNDTLRTGTVSGQLHGGTGTNQFDGGTGADQIFTSSNTDVIEAGTGANRVFDTTTLRSGDRTVANGVGTDWWYFGQYPGDSVARIRPSGVGSGTKIVASLTRPGIQQLVAYDLIDVELNNNTEPQSKSIVDVIASSTAVNALGNGGPNELLDITIPTGSWTTDGIGDAFVIDPTNSSYGNIGSISMGQTRIHGPWANTNEHYAHRVIRDLMFRFPTDAERDQLEAQLIAGTKTPASTVAGLMNTDEYRGLDVDRVFVKYLRRAADPGGRTYWINSLRNGKALWRFRAQLFGSNEYFTKAGGTNAAYVTRAYNDVLGRNPDPSGQTYWTNKLNNGADRGQVALQFMNAPEARRRLVEDQYLRFEESLPTTAERDFWVARIPTATGELDLIAALASGSEYYEFD